VGSLCLRLYKACLNLYYTLINVPKLLSGSAEQCPVFIQVINDSTFLLPPAFCGYTV
jgi:hypothetical protein